MSTEAPQIIQEAQAQNEAAQRQAELDETFAKVAAFAESPDREFAASPDIREATGLDHEKVMGLGYGSYGDLEKDALTWKAGKDAEAAKEAGRQEGEQRHQAFAADLDDYRTKRDAADERIERISYRQKLEAGGELSLKRNPELAEKLKQEAIDQASDEGLAVGHLQPEHVAVPVNEAAEASAREHAALLKAFDRSVLRAHSDDLLRDFPEGESAEEKGVDVDKHFDRLVEAGIIETAASASEAIAPVATIAEPIQDASPKGLRARVKRIFGKTRDALMTPVVAGYTAMKARGEKDDQSQEGWTRKRKLLVAGIGATVLVAAAALEYKSGGGFGHVFGNHEGGHGSGAAGGHGVGHGGSGGGHNPGGAHGGGRNGGGGHGNHGGGHEGHGAAGHGGSEGSQTGHQVEIGKQGVWGDVTKIGAEHGHKLSESQVHEYVSKIMDHNTSVSWKNARDIPSGTHYEIPHEVWEELTKTKS